MMQETAIYEALSIIFQDAFERDDLVLTPELSAADVADWDSFKQIEILIASEEKFGIKFTTQEMDSLKNVGDLVATIAAHVAAV